MNRHRKEANRTRSRSVSTKLHLLTTFCATAQPMASKAVAYTINLLLSLRTRRKEENATSQFSFDCFYFRFYYRHFALYAFLFIVLNVLCLACSTYKCETNLTQRSFNAIGKRTTRATNRESVRQFTANENDEHAHTRRREQKRRCSGNNDAKIEIEKYNGFWCKNDTKLCGKWNKRVNRIVFSLHLQLC